MRRGLRQAREERCFRKVQLCDVFLKIRLRRCLNAVGAIAVIDGVEIERENLVFGITARDLDSENRFLDFALGRLFGRKKDVVFIELLCDGGRAADGTLIANEVINRANEGIPVNAGIV